MEKNRSTVIKVTQWDVTVSWESPASDLSASEMVDAYVGLLRSLTYPEKGIASAMMSWLEEHGYFPESE